MTGNLYFDLIMVSIATHVIRSIYEILKHKQVIKPNKISFVIILINMILLWGSWVTLCEIDEKKVFLSNFIHYAGIFLCAIGVIIFFVALFTIKTLESYDGDIITYGIYSKIRHPMYLAFIFWLIGFPLFFGSLYLLILSFFFIVNVLFWRYLEEIELGIRFSSYAEYKKSTIF